MKSKNNLFEDFAKLSANLASGLYESGKGVSEAVRSKTNSFARSADLVTRDEFEVLKSIAMRVKSENESMGRDVAEIKKQLQNISSALDVLKESKNSGGAENNKKLVEDLRVFGEAVEERIRHFENETKFQQQEIEKIYSLLDAQAQVAKPSKTKKSETVNLNQSLFGEEGN